MRDNKYSFNTANSKELLPLIGTRSWDIPNDAQSMTFYLYVGVDPREYFKVEFVISELGLVKLWYFHGYYFDEHRVLQQIFNDFSIDPISLTQLKDWIEKDIDYAMSEWLRLKQWN